MSPTPHARWSPTREQLMVLEELYRRGMRNPKAVQIQGIAAYLSGFGKIQSKNVFYWFQNHKARDRLKIRNKMQQQHLMQLQHCPDFQSLSSSADIIRSSPPTPPSVLVPRCFSPHDSLATQVRKAYNPHAAAAAGLEKQAWWKDLRAESPARTNGHDHMMTADVGFSPTASGCRSGPLETLELFPLRPASVTNQH